MLRRFQTIFVFILSSIWFAVFFPWTSFRDPDAHYHAMLSWIMWHAGPVHAFPWLDLTTLGQSYADQHFLFHVLTIPFQMLFGMEMGLRAVTILTAALLVTIAFGCAKAWGIRTRWAVVAMLLLQFSLVFRLDLGKASALALVWFLLGLTAMVIADRREGRTRQFGYILGGLAGLGFILSHGGWSLLLFMQGIFLAVQIGWLRWFEQRTWKQVFTLSSIWVLLTTIGGIAIGWLMHPNALAMWSFLRVQLIDVMFAHPSDIALGAEWQSPGIAGGVSLMNVSLLLILMMGMLLMMYPKREIAWRDKRLLCLSGILEVVLIALLFKSSRFVEYAAFFVAFPVALMMELIDWQQVRERSFRLLPFKKMVRAQSVCVAIGVLAAVLVIVQGVWSFQSLQDKSFFRTIPADASSFLSQLPAGSRLFHLSWDMFPVLFARAPQLKFVSGMDPTFLAARDHQLAKITQDMRQGNVPEDWPDIVRGVGAEYVFVEPQRTPEFAKQLAASKEVKNIFSSDEVMVYLMNP